MRIKLPLLLAAFLALSGCATKVPNPAHFTDPIEFAKAYKKYDEPALDLPTNLFKAPIEVTDDHKSYSSWWCGNPGDGRYRDFHQRMDRVCRNIGGQMFTNEWCRDAESGAVPLFRYSLTAEKDGRCQTSSTRIPLPSVTVRVDVPLDGVDPKTDSAWKKFAASQGFVTKATSDRIYQQEVEQARINVERQIEERKRQQEAMEQHEKWKRKTGYLLHPSSKGTTVCSKRAIDGHNYKAFIEGSNRMKLQLRLAEELKNGRYVVLQNQRIIWDNVNNWKECQ